MIFYLKFDLPRLQQQAERCGMVGENWRERLLRDLLFDGQLAGILEAGFDGEHQFRFLGRKSTIVAAEDRFRSDTLFVFAASPRPAGAPRHTSAMPVAGPWAVLPPGTRDRVGSPSVMARLQTLLPSGPPAAPPKTKVTKGPITTKIKGLAALKAPPKSLRSNGQGCSTPEQPVDLASPQAPPPPMMHRASVATPSHERMEAQTMPCAGTHAAGSDPALERVSALRQEPVQQRVTKHPQMSDASEPTLGHRNPFREEASPTIASAPTDADSDPNPILEEGAPRPEDPARTTAPAEPKKAEKLEPVAVQQTPGPEEPAALAAAPAGSEQFGGPGAWRQVAIKLAAKGAPQVMVFLAADDPCTLLQQKRAEIEESLSLLSRELEALPSLESLSTSRGIMEVILSAVPDSLPAPANLPPDMGVDRLTQVLTALSSRSCSVLPAWTLGLDPKTNDSKSRILIDDHLSDNLLECVEWIERTFHGDPPHALRDLPEEPGLTAASRLAAAWGATEARLRRLDDFQVPPHVGFARTCPIQQLEIIGARVQSWSPWLHQDALIDMWTRLDAIGLDAWLELTDPAGVDRLPPNAMALILAQRTFDHIVNIRELSTRAQGTDRAPPAQQVQPSLLGIAHAVSESGHLEASPLVLVEHDAKEAYVWFHLPLRVRASAPVSGRLQVRVRGDYMKTIPAHLGVPEGYVLESTDDGGRVIARTIHAAPERWYRKSEETWYLDIAFSLPASRANADDWLRRSKGLTMQIEAINATHGTCAGSLTFARFWSRRPSFSIPIRDITDSETMQQAPLGVQDDYQQLEPLVREGVKSFYVAAPRRFGKTTLLHHLAEVAASQASTKVFVVSLMRNASPEDSMHAVVAAIREQMRQSHGIEPEMPVAPGITPSATTFHRLRQVLAEKNFSKAIIFVDEAQSLVPRRDRGKWGGELKTLIENELARPREKLATMSFVLVGTMALPERLGANCRNFMSVNRETVEFKEESLAKFLKVQTKDEIFSTASARIAIAQESNNLYTLLALLREIFTTLGQEGRVFFIRSDVRDAKARLVERYERRFDSDLWAYVSAELSNTDEWDPIDSYPVALALALQEGPQMPFATLVENCVGWLDKQLALASIQSASVTPERVTVCLDELRRLGILRPDNSFQRPLLRDLLRLRAATHPFVESKDIAVLARLAVDLISWPEEALPRSAGGQAQVFLSQDKTGPIAWRLCDVSDRGARRRFVRMCAALQVLRDSRTRLPGDEYLPRVRRAGFDLDDPNRGIMVYDWVEGETLDKTWSDMSEPVRAHVVGQVARALASLRARGVIHRDVHARNIVVDGNLKAVLIDFGMACIADSSSRSALVEPRGLAPELREGGLPSFATDVYALSLILEGPEPGRRLTLPGLADLHRMMRFTDPTQRPQASTVAEAIERVLVTTGFSESKHRAANAVDAIIESTETEWLFEVLLYARDAAVARRAGFTHWDEARAMEVAHCLNSVFAAWVRNRGSEDAEALARLQWQRGPSLAAVSAHMRSAPASARRLACWKGPSVHVVGTLRNAWAHPERRKDLLQEAKQLVGRANHTGAFLRHLKEVAILLDAAAQSQGVIGRFVDLFG